MKNPYQRDDLVFCGQGDNPFILTHPRTKDEVPLHPESIRAAVEVLQIFAHNCAVSVGWHNDPETGERVEWNKGESMMLMVREISEAMEADRRDAMDDKLTHRIGEEVELADALLRIFNYSGQHRLDIAGAFVEKAVYNLHRPDHKPHARVAKGGKRF